MPGLMQRDRRHLIGVVRRRCICRIGWQCACLSHWCRSARVRRAGDRWQNNRQWLTFVPSTEAVANAAAHAQRNSQRRWIGWLRGRAAARAALSLHGAPAARPATASPCEAADRRCAPAAVGRHPQARRAGAPAEARRSLSCHSSSADQWLDVHRLPYADDVSPKAVPQRACSAATLVVMWF